MKEPLPARAIALAPPRILELARDGAKLRHFGAIEREHDHEDFETCPHPDCKLVRGAIALAPPEQKDEDDVSRVDRTGDS